MSDKVWGYSLVGSAFIVFLWKQQPPDIFHRLDEVLLADGGFVGGVHRRHDPVDIFPFTGCQVLLGCVGDETQGLNDPVSSDVAEVFGIENGKQPLEVFQIVRVFAMISAVPATPFFSLFWRQ